MSAITPPADGGGGKRGTCVPLVGFGFHGAFGCGRTLGLSGGDGDGDGDGDGTDGGLLAGGRNGMFGTLPIASRKELDKYLLTSAFHSGGFGGGLMDPPGPKIGASGKEGITGILTGGFAIIDLLVFGQRSIHHTVSRAGHGVIVCS